MSNEAEQVQAAIEQIYRMKVKFVLFGFLYEDQNAPPLSVPGLKLCFAGVGGGGESTPQKIAGLLKAIQEYGLAVIETGLLKYHADKQKSGGPTVV